MEEKVRPLNIVRSVSPSNVICYNLILCARTSQITMIGSFMNLCLNRVGCILSLYHFDFIKEVELVKLPTCIH